MRKEEKSVFPARSLRKNSARPGGGGGVVYPSIHGRTDVSRSKRKERLMSCFRGKFVKKKKKGTCRNGCRRSCYESSDREERKLLCFLSLKDTNRG